MYFKILAVSKFKFKNFTSKISERKIAAYKFPLGSFSFSSFDTLNALPLHYEQPRITFVLKLKMV